MNDRAPLNSLAAARTSAGPSFAQLPFAPRQHFALAYYLGVLRILDALSRKFESTDEAMRSFPFLADYVNELADHGLVGCAVAEAIGRWTDELSAWELRADRHLPLVALRQAIGGDPEDTALLMAAGVSEEDSRFEAVLAALSSDARPVLTPTSLGDGGPDGERDVRVRLAHLEALGCLQGIDHEQGSSRRGLRVPSLLWQALRTGSLIGAPGQWQHRPAHGAASIEALHLSDRQRIELHRAAASLAEGAADVLVVRGPANNGRTAALAALAREAGRGILVCNTEASDTEGMRAPIGPLAVALNALPVLRGARASDRVELGNWNSAYLPVGLVLGPRVSPGRSRAASLHGGQVLRIATVELARPGVPERRQLWQRALGSLFEARALEFGDRWRWSSGTILASGTQASALARASGSAEVECAAVRAAARADTRDLDVLARRIDATEDWARLAVNGDTLHELRALEARCRLRERLGEDLGPAFRGALDTGVRALFKGPSGTGKTLAARVLAGVLQLDLYRVDLAAVVDKYIGETEKNLERLFDRAEELDAVLLLDEGDALLGRRTGVQSATDRYANLEVNFLLQRLESYDGIVLVTTNAGERIDAAFQRRMDVVIDFPLPDAAQRLAIWRLHLPARHAVGSEVLRDASARCALSGGQIRNAVLYAALLAAEGDRPLEWSDLESAIQREYRKAGALCPLRAPATRPAAALVAGA